MKTISKILSLSILSYLSGTTDSIAQNPCNFIITGEVLSNTNHMLPGIQVNYTGISNMGGPPLAGVGYTNFYGQFYLNVPVPDNTGTYTFFLDFQGCDTGIAIPSFTLTSNNCGTPYWIGTVTLTGCDVGPCPTTITVNPTTPQAGQAVAVTATGNGGINPLTVVLFENSAPIGSASGATVTWTPSTANTYYDICVVAHYPTCLNYACENIPVTGNNPACFLHHFEPITNLSGNTLQYFAYYYAPPTSGSATFMWYFGDGQTSYQPQGTHTYLAPGYYTVCATASWSNGCVIDTCLGVHVQAPSGSCEATLYMEPNTALNDYLAYVLAVVPNSPDLQVSQVTWIINNATALVGNYPATPYTFPGPGTYNVCAQIVYTNGCIYTVCDTLNIAPPTNPCSNFQILANAAPSNNSNVVNFWTGLLSGGTPSTVVWYLPNGNTYVGYQGSFTFNAGGTVSICAVATWPNGCVDTSCLTLNLSLNNNGSICGCVQVDYSGNLIPADAGLAYLVQYNPFNNTLNALANTGISNGQFCFPNVAPGAYLVKVALVPNSPYYADFVPTYFSNVPFWWQATQIVVPPSNPNVNIGCITMIPGVNPGGPGFIGGSIFQGANKSAPGDPVPNVEVLLLDPDDSPVAYTYTNHLGQYSFNNLPYGTYKVWPEQAGIYTTPAIVTIGPDQPSLDNVNIALTSSGFVSVEPIGSHSMAVTIGPNPTEGPLTLRFHEALRSTVELRINDLLGRPIWTRQVNASENLETTIDMSHLNPGLYQMIITAEGKESCFKVIRK
ncbi:MAG: carboxypeptidase regulatory-like domain-containing protein [Flavobacteriales bacterium]|nr:carboxypeptidase regulatory-like domain-containing protein [Flavobacteriales bacterium]